MMKQERILERKVLQNYVPTLMMKQTRRKKINRNDVNMPNLMMKQERILVRKVLQNYVQQERILVRKVLQNYVPTLMLKLTRKRKINRNEVNVPNLMMKQERILVRKVLQNYDQQERILVRKVLQNYVPTLMMKQTRRKKINRNE